MVNDACAVSESGLGKYFEWIVIILSLFMSSVSSNFPTEFQINPLESGFHRPTPLPSGISWASAWPPQPLTISNSLHFGGKDIFWNHTIVTKPASYMPTLPDYPGVSRIRHQSTGLLYGSLYLPDKIIFWAFLCLSLKFSPFLAQNLNFSYS